MMQPRWRHGGMAVPGLFLASLLFSASLHAQHAAKRYAVLVGINQYEHPRLTPLRYAVNDVTELADLLDKAGYEVALLTDRSVGDRKPTQANVDTQLRGVLRRCRRGDTVLVALAGHGLQFEGQTDCFFCPADARPFKDEIATLLSLGKVYAEMEKSFAAMKVLLVDACRDDPDAARGARGIDADSAPVPPKGVAALFSCSAGQRAFEVESLRHGVFFHYVLDGLRGAARDSDEEVTFESLSAYVRKQVGRRVPQIVGGGARQSPNLKADLSGESLVLLQLDPKESPSRPALQERDPRVLVRQALERGDAYYKDGQAQKALAAYAEAIRLDSTCVAAYIKRATVYLNEGDEPRAIAAERKVVELDPDGAFAHYYRGWEACERGDFDKGIDECNTAIQLEPRLAQAYNIRAWVYNEKGMPDRAIEEANEAVRLEPRLTFAYGHRGWAWWQKGEYDRAIEECSRAIQIGPKNPYAYNHRGNAYLSQANPERAIREYTRAIELKSDYAWAYYNRAAAFSRIGNSERARADRARALSLNPDLPR